MSSGGDGDSIIRPRSRAVFKNISTRPQRGPPLTISTAAAPGVAAAVSSPQPQPQQQQQKKLPPPSPLTQPALTLLSHRKLSGRAPGKPAKHDAKASRTNLFDNDKSARNGQRLPTDRHHAGAAPAVRSTGVLGVVVWILSALLSMCRAAVNASKGRHFLLKLGFLCVMGMLVLGLADIVLLSTLPTSTNAAIGTARSRIGSFAHGVRDSLRAARRPSNALSMLQEIGGTLFVPALPANNLPTSDEDWSALLVGLVAGTRHEWETCLGLVATNKNKGNSGVNEHNVKGKDREGERMNEHMTRRLWEASRTMLQSDIQFMQEVVKKSRKVKRVVVSLGSPANPHTLLRVHNVAAAAGGIGDLGVDDRSLIDGMMCDLVSALLVLGHHVSVDAGIQSSNSIRADVIASADLIITDMEGARNGIGTKLKGARTARGKLYVLDRLGYNPGNPSSDADNSDEFAGENNPELSENENENEEKEESKSNVNVLAFAPSLVRGNTVEGAVAGSLFLGAPVHWNYPHLDLPNAMWRIDEDNDADDFAPYLEECAAAFTKHDSTWMQKKQDFNSQSRQEDRRNTANSYLGGKEGRGGGGGVAAKLGNAKVAHQNVWDIQDVRSLFASQHTRIGEHTGDAASGDSKLQGKRWQAVVLGDVWGTGHPDQRLGRYTEQLREFNSHVPLVTMVSDPDNLPRFINTNYKHKDLRRLFTESAMVIALDTHVASKLEILAAGYGCMVVLMHLAPTDGARLIAHATGGMQGFHSQHRHDGRSRPEERFEEVGGQQKVELVLKTISPNLENSIVESPMVNIVDFAVADDEGLAEIEQIMKHLHELFNAAAKGKCLSSSCGRLEGFMRCGMPVFEYSFPAFLRRVARVVADADDSGSAEAAAMAAVAVNAL